MKNRFALLAGVLLLCAFAAFGGPADGSWSAVGAAQGAPQALVLQASGENLSGTADGIQINNGKISGQSVWFTVTRTGVVYNYKGTISGAHLELHETLSNGSGHRTLQFKHN